MGLKAVELQIALPRTQDAGKMQEQMLKQGKVVQENLNEQMKDKDQIKQAQVNQYEDVEKRTITDKDQERLRTAENKKNKQTSDNDIDHPYLGQTIDLSR